jgi:DNA-binding transcriptional regulator YiaG
VSKENCETIEDGAKRYLERRQLDRFIDAIVDAKNTSGLSFVNFSIAQGHNKNTIYEWVRKEKRPSQHSQLTVSQKLGIAYEPFLFIQNEQGDYPCGLRICNTCQSEFLVYKKQNYLTHNCATCIDSKIDYRKAT